MLDCPLATHCSRAASALWHGSAIAHTSMRHADGSSGVPSRSLVVACRAAHAELVLWHRNGFAHHTDGQRRWQQRRRTPFGHHCVTRCPHGASALARQCYIVHHLDEQRQWRLACHLARPSSRVVLFTCSISFGTAAPYRSSSRRAIVMAAAAWHLARASSRDVLLTWWHRNTFACNIDWQRRWHQRFGTSLGHRFVTCCSRADALQPTALAWARCPTADSKHRACSDMCAGVGAMPHSRQRERGRNAPPPTASDALARPSLPAWPRSTGR